MTRQWKRQTTEEITRWVELDLMYLGNVRRLSQATGYTPNSVRRWLRLAREHQANIVLEETDNG
jgi:transposase-like protein